MSCSLDDVGDTGLVFNDFYPKEESKIQLTRNSRYATLGRKYNIVNRIKNFQKFYFTTEPVIFNMGVASLIATDNKSEALFLFSILNSSVSYEVLKSNLKLTNEKEFQVAIKSIKQYIRIPQITPNNQAVKTEIIKQTEAMLALEKIAIRDIVDFSEISSQKFDSASVSGNDLVLWRDDKKYKCKIQKGRSELVARVVAEAFGGLVPSTKISLSALKSTPALDVDKQTGIKAYIDDLVFALYFSVTFSSMDAPTVRKACKNNKFYSIISEQ
jgi:hypothetical protein